MIIQNNLQYLFDNWVVKHDNFERDWFKDCFQKIVSTNITLKKASNIHQPDPCYSLEQYFNMSISGHNWNDFESKDSYWYNTQNNIAVYGYLHSTDYFNSRVRNKNYSEDRWCISNDNMTEFPITKVGLLTDPLIRFLICLKFDNQDLVTNVTGHYRGGWICGKQYLKDTLLSSKNTWWLESQVSKYEKLNTDVILSENVVQEYITNNKHWVNKFESNNWDQYALFSILELMKNRQPPVATPSNEQSKYSVYIDRHYWLEESAWEFMKDPELYDLLVIKYKNDFTIGNFDMSPRRGTWHEYWEEKVK